MGRSSVLHFPGGSIQLNKRPKRCSKVAAICPPAQRSKRRQSLEPEHLTCPHPAVAERKAERPEEMKVEFPKEEMLPPGAYVDTALSWGAPTRGPFIVTRSRIQPHQRKGVPELQVKALTLQAKGTNTSARHLSKVMPPGNGKRGDSLLRSGNASH